MAAALVALLGIVVIARLADAATAPAPATVVALTAQRFAYAPETIIAKVGVPLVLEITALDHDHGFNLPAFGVRADLKAGTTTRVEIVPDRIGSFAFHCDVFCGDGHEEMTGTLHVVE
ncbi:MAG TPA: cupredoxin domain-containing protein [Candidatus Binatia bacterium]|jgi:cytochrome c oxidase subunit 2